jgi:hypothetical protein
MFKSKNNPKGLVRGAGEIKALDFTGRNASV